MFIKDHYFIDTKFMFMMTHYDRCGNPCAQVTSTKGTFIVDQSPVQVLNESIQQIGFNYRGALETSKKLLGEIHMYPIMINPIYRIVVFPTRSHHHEDTIWFNPQQIKRTLSFNRKTMILFNNGTTILVPIRLASFNTKLKNAEQLEKMTAGIILPPFTFVLDPKKRPAKEDK
ncbi:competence protein ComK [Mesobacillus maritimus]|uniref:Competence protein ComK n=1 Tax=Mesobacillus maritimus TaxID=1643336 RepID=A0ABS7K4V9_9BACI|nr:competence protein ComK [Mesobacillus maritimus]MBY0097309.1 competence protein ComK [Mesobacillus maritimus]